MRRGFTLPEVLVAGAIVSSSLVTVVGLIRWTYAATRTALTRELARTVAADTMAVLSGESFQQLRAHYGSGTTRRQDPTTNPLVNAALNYMAQDAQGRGLSTRADFRPAPGNTGYLQVAVSYPVGDHQESVVASRLLPDPRLSGIARDSGPLSLLQRATEASGGQNASPEHKANDAYYRSLLPKIATNPAARFLDMAMATDQRDGKYDVNWRQMVDLKSPQTEQWDAMARALSAEALPDGVYSVSTQDFPDSSGAAGTDRPRKIRLLTLRDFSDREHFVLEQDYAGEKLSLGNATGRDLGDFPIAKVLTGAAERPPREALVARVMVTDTRVYLFKDRFDVAGRRVPFAPQLAIFTANELLDPFKVTPALNNFLVKAARMAGVKLSRRQLRSVASAETW
jgi:prepilin-type N-terminal cleavage/methylation domain-containing protein